MLLNVSTSIRFQRMLREYSHAETDHAIRRVPEADVSTVCSSFWWIPWHYKQEDLDENEQYDSDVPGLELRATKTQPLPLTSDEVQSDRHDEEEDGVGVVLQVDDCGSIPLVFQERHVRVPYVTY